jgi:hypothetical protein
MLRLGWLAVCLGLFGCSTLGVGQRANTVGEGNSQIGVGAAAQFVVSGGPVIAAPRLDFAYRGGLSDAVDLGLHAGLGYLPSASLLGGELEFTSKFQLTDPSNTGFVFSIAPSLGVSAALFTGSALSGNGTLALSLPIAFLFGIGIGEGHQLVIAPKLYNWLGITGGAVSYSFALGGAVGMAFRVSDGLQVMPEVGILAPVGGGISSAGASFGTGSGAGLQLGLTLLTGSGR